MMGNIERIVTEPVLDQYPVLKDFFNYNYQRSDLVEGLASIKSCGDESDLHLNLKHNLGLIFKDLGCTRIFYEYWHGQSADVVGVRGNEVLIGEARVFLKKYLKMLKAFTDKNVAAVYHLSESGDLHIYARGSSVLDAPISEVFKGADGLLDVISMLDCSGLDKVIYTDKEIII